MEKHKIKSSLTSTERNVNTKTTDFRMDRKKSVILPDLQLKFLNKKSKAGAIISSKIDEKAVRFQSNKSITSISKPSPLRSKKLSVASRLRDYSVLPKVSLQK